MNTHNVGFAIDQRHGKVHQKSLKSRRAHKPGATHKRALDRKRGKTRYAHAGCSIRQSRATSVQTAWFFVPPKPIVVEAPKREVVVIHETASQPVASARPAKPTRTTISAAEAAKRARGGKLRLA